jgi:putative ABC transport system permease protein
MQQRAQHRSDFVVRTAQDPSALGREIERAVASIDQDQPLSSLTTLDSLVSETFALPRFNLTLAGVFAACALALAIAGVFAQAMQSVAERTHEIGIRVALGAQRADVVRMVLRDGAALALLGIAIGALGSIAAGLAGGMRPTPASVVVASVLVLLVAICASTLPAHRATRVDAADALRGD